MTTIKRVTALCCAVMLNTAMLTGCGLLEEFVRLDSYTEPAETEEPGEDSGTQASQTAITDPTLQTQTQTTVPESADGTADTQTTASTSVQTGGIVTGGTQVPGTRSSSVQTSKSRQNGSSGPAQTSDGERTTETTAETSPYDPGDLRVTVANMTLEQKAAQMMLVGIVDEATAKQAAAAGVGGLCMFAKPFKGKSKAQVRTMDAEIQSKAKIPLLMSVDEEGGTINRVSINSKLRAVPFWLGRNLYASGGWDLVISDTKEKAELLLDLGLNVNLAPVADVPLDKSNYIYNRCFSLDPHETAEYIRTVVTEMKQDGLGSTLKHFPGYGGSVDTHKSMGYDDRDYSAFENGDFLPFIAGIQAGADAVMVSHNIVKCMDADKPASLSPAVHRILREELGFDGVVISDDLGMDAITQFTGGKNPAVAAVLAGNDLVTFADYKTSVRAITEAVQDGTIAESQIDASVLRILNWKHSLGLI